MIPVGEWFKQIHNLYPEDLCSKFAFIMCLTMYGRATLTTEVMSVA